jgi:hypothetical protein
MGGGGGGIPPNQPPKGPLESAASSDDSGKGSSAVGLWAMYTAALEKQPILTKAMTSFTGFALGDFLAQKFLSKSDEVDFKQVRWLGLVATSTSTRAAWSRMTDSLRFCLGAAPGHVWIPYPRAHWPLLLQLP